MNTSTNENNELTPLITQPVAITRRSFIKRTASTALVTAFALTEFVSASIPPLPFSESTRYILHCTNFAGCLYNATNSESPVTLEPEPDNPGEVGFPWKAEGATLSWDVPHPALVYIHPDKDIECQCVFVRYTLRIALRLTGTYTEVKGPRPAGTPRPLLASDDTSWGFFNSQFDFEWEVKTRLKVEHFYEETETGLPGSFSSNDINDTATVVGSVAVDTETGKIYTYPTQDATPPQIPGIKIIPLKSRMPLTNDMLGTRYMLQMTETSCNLLWEACLWKARRNADGELINPEFIGEGGALPSPTLSWAEYPGEKDFLGRINPDGASSWNNFHVDPYLYGVL